MKSKLPGQLYNCKLSVKKVRLVKTHKLHGFTEKQQYAVFTPEMGNLIGYVSKRICEYFEFHLSYRRLPIYYWIAFKRNGENKIISYTANTRTEVIGKLLGW